MSNPNHDPKTGKFSDAGGAHAAMDQNTNVAHSHTSLPELGSRSGMIKQLDEMTPTELAHYNRPFSYKSRTGIKEARWNRHKQDTLNSDRSSSQNKLKT